MPASDALTELLGTIELKDAEIAKLKGAIDKYEQRRHETI